MMSVRRFSLFLDFVTVAVERLVWRLIWGSSSVYLHIVCRIFFINWRMRESAIEYIYNVCVCVCVCVCVYIWGVCLFSALTRNYSLLIVLLSNPSNSLIVPATTKEFATPLDGLQHSLFIEVRVLCYQTFCHNRFYIAVVLTCFFCFKTGNT